MTQFFNYADLTWPEINALPRHCPLIIPLGQGYDLNRLSEALENPPQIGMLPSIPFGWAGSGLRVPESLLHNLLVNLIDSLREDGFSRVFALTPQETQLELGSMRIALFHPSQLYPESSATLLPADGAQHKVVIIPVGHIEQHGYHLAMSTDADIIEAIAQRTVAAVPEQAMSLPVMPYGVSTHRAAFAGTLNAGGRAFEDFWCGVVDILAGRGFDRIYFINGHGGNHSFLVNIVKFSGERHPTIFCATAWLYLSGPAGIAALEKYRSSPIGGMGHACELETSLMMHLYPHRVQIEKAADETDFVATPAYYMDWVEGGALIANPPWNDDTATGAYGAGSLSTPEKGKAWLEAAIAEKVGHIAEIHEQLARRQTRRQSGYGLWGRKS